MIIEKVSGKTYAENLKEKILNPLNMADSGFESDDRVIPHIGRNIYRILYS